MTSGLFGAHSGSGKRRKLLYLLGAASPPTAMVYLVLAWIMVPPAPPSIGNAWLGLFFVTFNLLLVFGALCFSLAFLAVLPPRKGYSHLPITRSPTTLLPSRRSKTAYRLMRWFSRLLMGISGSLALVLGFLYFLIFPWGPSLSLSGVFSIMMAIYGASVASNTARKLLWLIAAPLPLPFSALVVYQIAELLGYSPGALVSDPAFYWLRLEALLVLLALLFAILAIVAPPDRTADRSEPSQ